MAPNPFITNPGPVPVPAPIALPYPVGSLHHPLTNPQRLAIRAFIAAHGISTTQLNDYIKNWNGSSIGGIKTTNDVDDALISLYDATAQGGGGGTGATINKYPGSGVLSGINAVGDFFNKLSQPNTWIRVAEFTAGGVLLIVGLHAMLKMSPTYKSTVGTAGTAAKYIK